VDAPCRAGYRTDLLAGAPNAPDAAIRRAPLPFLGTVRITLASQSSLEKRSPRMRLSASNVLIGRVWRPSKQREITLVWLGDYETSAPAS
jgi:hypothetical protein